MSEVRYAERLKNMQGNVIREILKLTQQPDIISFAGGLPSPDSFPTEILADIAREVILEQRDVLQYGTTEGYPPLREFIAEWVKDIGINATVDEVIITSGSQQGIDLISKAMIDAGDTAVMESPTYLAAIQILKTYQANFSVAHGDHEGVWVDELEHIIARENPKLAYLVPTFQNPTGITLNKPRRQAIGAMLARHNTLLVEDDPYGRLSFTGEIMPAIKSFDVSDRVIYLGSFSKIISPGLRLGFAVGEKSILRKMVIGKQGTDVHTNNLAQAMVYEFCRRGHLVPHIESIRQRYSEKLRVMQDCLRLLPAEIKWTKPTGGLFIWGELPQGMDAAKLLVAAVKEKVAFIPGESFYVEGGHKSTLRVNFSNATPDNIREGFKRLARALENYE
ncbi:MAG: PLP-dependent aminotransferase family protein [Firmicutes bacterium]|nr:PLP-dependent aminotransferase family protein [Dethiobacter sp.]MBS3887871.1 PLP-dependent aminotransferase family protein [Bacillota bacterium]MBS4053718.1 PLP-dependent aminotransferase family protein [Thermaerobacter sp.]